MVNGWYFRKSQNSGVWPVFCGFEGLLLPNAHCLSQDESLRIYRDIGRAGAVKSDKTSRTLEIAAKTALLQENMQNRRSGYPEFYVLTGTVSLVLGGAG